MRAILSKGLYIGFFAVLFLVALFVLVHRLFAVVEGREPLPVREALLATILWALVGAAIGRWLEARWEKGHGLAVIGFLFGTGFYFLCLTLSAIRLLRVLILINLPGLIVFRGGDGVVLAWLTLIVSWLAWGFIGYLGGRFGETRSA